MKETLGSWQNRSLQATSISGGSPSQKRKENRTLDACEKRCNAAQNPLRCMTKSPSLADCERRAFFVQDLSQIAQNTQFMSHFGAMKFDLIKGQTMEMNDVSQLQDLLPQ